MRLFIAAPIPEELKEKLGQLMRKLAGRAREMGADVKWVNPHNFHVTLKFLGECEDSKKDAILEALNGAVQNTGPFSFTLRGVGCFPEKGLPRVVWVGVEEGLEKVAALAGQVETALEPLGFEKESRPFSGHLTLGRLKSPKNAEKVRSLMEVHQQEVVGTLMLDEICLVQSVLSPSGLPAGQAGPTHTTLHAIRL